MNVLKPCPFCGGEPERLTLDELGDNFGGDVITCKRCGASSHVEFGRKENLVSRWNHRPETERLVEALDIARNEIRSLGCDPDDIELALTRINRALSSLKEITNVYF